MPELPDVEAIRRYLQARGLVERTITGARVFWPKAVRSGTVEAFVSQVAGRQVREVARRAKYLLLRLDGSLRASLIVHLRMTGSLLLESATAPEQRFASAVFALDDGRELRFVDRRRLGMLWLVPDEAQVISGLGPEPLDPAFTPLALGERLQGRRVPIKALLMDQAVVAGIGNIYADEVLFGAGLHPLRPARELSQREVKRLHRAMVTVLQGATEKLVARVVPVAGPPTESREGLKTLRVPRMSGAPCGQCGTPIQRLGIRGRSAYVCEQCQRVGLIKNGPAR